MSWPLNLDIKEFLKDAKRLEWEKQLAEDRKTITKFILNSKLHKSNLIEGLSDEDVAFFLKLGNYEPRTPDKDFECIPFNQFVLNLYDYSKDNFFLEKIFCPKKRKKIIFPVVDAASENVRVTYDIDSISFTGYLFPFKSESSQSLPIKICLTPTQFRNICNDTCIRMIDPVTNDNKPLRYYKHTYLMDVYGFAGYIFFPWLNVEERKFHNYNNKMLNEDFHFFIEEIFLPSLKSVKPDGTFPDNVRCKNQFKGINKNSFNSIQLSVDLFDNVINEMRQIITLRKHMEMDRFRDFFFHFQAIGIKNIYKGEKDQAINRLVNFLENFVNLNCNIKAYYDIGVEFYYASTEDKYTLFWSNEGVESLYKGLDRRGSVTRSGTMYSDDLLGI